MKTILTIFVSLVVATMTNAQVINVIGDSYVANHREPVEQTWHYKLAKRHGLTYNNYGRNGSCIAFDRTNDSRFNFGPAMWVRYKDMDPEADYVIVIAGHNDADKCGDNPDSLRMFADSLEVFLTNVERQCPHARIGFVSPWYVPREGFAQVCEEIRSACARHNIPLLWNYSPDCIINVRDSVFRQTYFQGADDTAHLNDEGHDLFLPVAEKWFVENMMNAMPTQEVTLEAMVKVNKYFMDQVPDPAAPSFGGGRERESNLWTRGVYYEGLMALYKICPREDYYKYAYDWGEAHQWTPRHGIATRNADDYCCSQTYIDMYRFSGEWRMIEKAKKNADLIVESPQVDDWWWIDALQMGMPVLAKMGATLGEQKYFDKMWDMYEYTRDHADSVGLYNASDGLWWRNKNFVPPYKEPNGSNCYWSRGNGWVYAALVRVMDELPEDETHRSDYTSDFIAMSEALAKCQREDGFWNVSLHDCTDYGGKETSGTSLFVYGMAWGIRCGLLSRDKYLPIVLKAWHALTSEAIHPDGRLGYVQGTGKEPKDDQPVTYDSRPDFEDFGVGCFLLAGTEMYKLIDARTFRFDFTQGKQTKEGYTKVSPTDRYTPERGYGYDLVESPEKGSNSPFFFSVDVPDGNYRVTAVVGSKSSAAETTIRGESRRLFFENVATKKGQTADCSFVVNKRNRHISPTEDVRTNPREENKLNWDDHLTLEFNGNMPRLMYLTIERDESVPTVFLCGNSTVVDQDNEPWASWGQMIPRFFNDSIAFANYAESGECADTFIEVGRLKKALTQMKPGDYLIIEFGHNDMKQKGPGKGAYYSFMTSLKTFIDEARARGAHPILITPTCRRFFDEDGKVMNTHEDYPDAMRFLAKRENVPLIDLNEMTRRLYEAMGEEGSKHAFVHYPACTFPGQTEDLKDNTHFNTYGAYQIAKCVVEGMIEEHLPIVKYLRQDWKTYDPAHPDDRETFVWNLSPFTEVEKPAGN